MPSIRRKAPVEVSFGILHRKRTVFFMERKGYERRSYHKRRRRRYRKNILFTAAIMLIFVLGVVIFGSSYLERQSFTSFVAESSDKENLNESISNIEIDLKHLYSPYAILVDLASGNCLAEHKAQARIYPASLTKIMTAVLAIENTADMEEMITLPTDFFQQLYAEGASMAGFQPGESARLKDLLYGILLPSGAECCMAFADRIAGSEEAFAEMMNQKASELGMDNTHFCNATGLHDSEHYSTVKDISVLLQYALKNETFKEAFTSSRYSVQPSNQHPDGFTFYSTMFQYMDSVEVTGGKIIGGKTGYTNEAGLCLASLAEVGGKEYILVTAKADGTHQTEQFHILDAMNVYDQIGVYVTENKIIR